MTRPPAHVAAHINTTTGLDITAPNARNTATPSRCTRCGARILVGLDAERAAIPVRVDASALTRSDEVAALLAGRSTYTLTRDPRGRWLVRHRDHWTITGHPADTVTTVAAHRCGQLLGTPIPLTDRKPADDRSAHVPF